MIDGDDNTTLQLQIDTAEGPRIIPISGQHIITTADGQQFLTGNMKRHHSYHDNASSQPVATEIVFPKFIESLDK